MKRREAKVCDVGRKRGVSTFARYYIDYCRNKSVWLM